MAIFLASAAILPAQSLEPLETLRKGHPRIIALDSDIDRIRTLIAADEGARRVYASLVERARKLEGEPPVEYKVVGPRLLAQSRRCLDRIYTLALLYRLDGERRYLDRAVKELRAAAYFPDWNPSHFLDTAEMTHAFAIAYDWLYHGLTPEERAWIRRAIVDKGLDQAIPIYAKQGWWVTSKYNWNQVCNGGIGIGALAIAEDEPQRASKVLRNAVKSLPAAMASYAPDGGWAEGPGYWHYATRYAVYFLAALKTALGIDFGLSASQGFDRAGHFRIYSTGPSHRSFNYADASDRVGPAAEMFWLAQRFAQPAYAWQQHQLLKTSGGDALDLVWYRTEAESPKRAGWPPHALFQGVQVAFLRSNWESTDGIFVGVKGGDNKANHGHLDLGAFVLDAGGVRWAIDLGPDDYNLPGFFGKQRWNYYRLRTESHNTLLIDDENQDTRAEARIIGHRFRPNSAWVRIDLSQAYPGKVKRMDRTLALVQRKHVLVLDSLEATEPVQALWGMVTDAEVSLDGAKAELRKGGWTLAAEIRSPAEATFDVVSTAQPPPQAKNEGTRKLVVRLPEKVTKLALEVWLTPHRSGKPKPVVPANPKL
ncbi:MAG TPA: heparinase II/III family protein [Bryobacteraceae bacterium]|nr:heparinase II/III family protein [Bryobacteraceae bacterium]